MLHRLKQPAMSSSVVSAVDAAASGRDKYHKPNPTRFKHLSVSTTMPSKKRLIRKKAY
jgi:hypothetical protein